MPRSTSSKRARAPRARVAAAAAPARLAEGLVATERNMLGALAHDAQLAQEDALRAPDLGKLAQVQAEWAAEQWARTAQAWSGLWSVLLEAQATCWRDAEACTRAGLEPWLSAVRRPLPVDAALETPTDLTPMALMQRATTAWLVIGKACMGALEHDLEAAEPRTTVA